MVKSFYSKVSKKVLLNGVAAVAIFTTPCAAAAADATGSGASAGEVETLIVTANRREEKLSEVAASITAVGGEELRQRQITGFQELTSQVPGFVVQTLSQGFNRLILRGQNSGSTGASVATVIDDVPFNFVTSGGSSGLLAANFDTWDLQRIEVLRGPQGTLYGAAAQGGIIKYVTNEPNPARMAGAVEVGALDVKGGQTAGSIRGMVNLPFADGRAALRISAYQESLAGFVENPLLRETNVNDGYKNGVRASVLFEPTDKLKLRVTAFRQKLDSNGNGAVDIVGAARTPTVTPANAFDLVNGYTQNRYNDAIVDNKLTFVSGSAELDLGFATAVSLTSYGKIQTRFTSDITVSNAAPGLSYGDYFSLFVYRNPISIRGDQTEQLKKFNQEFRLSSKPGPLEWQVGVFYSKEDTVFNQFYGTYNISNRALSTGTQPGGSTQPVHYKEYSAFGEATYHFTPTIDLTVGGRYASSKQNSVQTQYPGILYPALKVTPGKVDDKDFTFSVSPRWKITPDTMIYARVASGYRPGGPLYAAPPAPTFYNSDRTVNYEAGFRTTQFDGRLSIDLTAYYIDWTDIQIITRFKASNGVTYSTTGNAGKAKSQGVEWNFVLKPVHGLSLGFLGAYTDAHLTEDALALGGRSGDELAYVPKWTYTLNADYEWPAFGDFEGYAGGSWTHVGERYSDFANAAVTSNHVRLPNYGSLNLHAGVRNDKYTVQAYVKNATDELGIVNYRNEGGFNQTGNANIITPRTYGVVLSARF